MRVTKLVVLLASLIGLTNCGGGGGAGGGGGDVAPPPPVSVTVSPASGSLEIGDSLQFTSEVNRGSYVVSWYVNDVLGGNETSGTITNAGLYKAPAAVPNPATVTVKAIPEADTTKSGTSPVTIYPKMAVSPTAAVLPAGQTQQFTANKAASWFVNNVEGGNATVGYISSSGLYTAPMGVPSPATVTIKASWQINAAKIAVASVTITEPSSVTISPTVVTLAAGSTQQFNANTAVDWKLSGASGNDRPLGSISASGIYMAPSVPPLSGKVFVTAVSRTDPNQKAMAIVTITFSNASLEGRYAFRLWGANGAKLNETKPYFVIGSLVADGRGGLSSAVFDLNRSSDPIANSPFTGTYSIGPDGRGRLNIVLSDNNEVGWRLVVTDANSGRLNAFGDGDSGWGSLERQDPISFPAMLSGRFAFAYDGVTSGGDFLAAAGMFTANGAGGLTSGLQDTNIDGAVAGNVGFSGSYSAAENTTGRGQLSITAGSQTDHYVYYLLSADAFIFSSMDMGRGLIGLALRQSGSPFSDASLTGNLAFDFSGGMPENAPVQMVGTGRFTASVTASGSGVISSGTQDRDGGGTSVDVPFTGTYKINTNGQGYASHARAGATDNLRLYMISPQSAFFLFGDRWLAASGRIRAQSNVPVSASSIKGTFGFGWRGTQLGASTVYSGQLTIDGESGTISGIADINEAGSSMEGIPVAGTFIMSGNGRGVASLIIGFSSSTMGIYVMDPQTLIMIENDPAVPNKFGPAFKQF